jgi:hypothetical protein
MKPGTFNPDYFGSIYFHAYDWSRFNIPNDYFRIQCVAVQMKLLLLDSVGCLDSELL